MLKYLFFLFVLFSNELIAQVSEVPTAPDLAQLVTADLIKTHLDTLASDALEGRETGKKGNNLAAEYISGVFKEMGLSELPNRNDYYQKVYFTNYNFDDSKLVIGKEKFKHLWNYYSQPAISQNYSIKENEIYFVGYGIDSENYTDYHKAKKIKDKVVLFYLDEPIDQDNNSRVTQKPGGSEWTGNLHKKLETAAKYGAKHAIVVDPNFDKNVGEWRKRLLNGFLKLGQHRDLGFINSTIVSPQVARQILDLNQKEVKKYFESISNGKKRKPLKIKTRVEAGHTLNVKTTESQNVLGYIEGTDTLLRDELVVLSAHYDHLGRRGSNIYNGADDNASGTSSVLAIAQAIKHAKDAGKGPKRSILVLLVTGEEKGLLGSRYYADNPVFPLDKTVADVNVDMIGRVDKKHKDNPHYIYVIGADRISTELHDINEELNSRHENLELDYTFNAEDDPNRYYYRSDHYNFAKKGIPSIFYFSGVHKDYHKSTDTADKILFDKTEKVARHIFYVTWEIANRSRALVRDKLNK